MEKAPARVKAACRAVLKSDNALGVTYSEAAREAFVWYQHLFLGRGKPSTHILAVNSIARKEFRQKAPVRLKRLVRRVRELLAGK